MVHHSVLPVAAALLLSHALRAGYNALSSTWRAETRRGLASVRRCLAHLCFWRCQALDELSKEAAARVRARQLRQFRSILVMLKWFLCAVTAAHVGWLRERHWLQDVLAVTGYAMTLLVDCCPWLVADWSMDVWYSCLMALAGLYTIPAWCSYDVMQESAIFLRGYGAALSVACQRVPTVVLWSVARTLCACWAVAASGPNIGPTAMDPLQNELAALSLVVVMTCWFAAHMEADCRREVEAHAVDERQGAVNKLLEMTYDVVVELDRDFHVAHPAPCLSSFLLRQSPGALQHVPFADLLFDESDQALFRSRLHAAPGTTASTDAFHLRMRDGNGIAIPVELISFFFQGLGGHRKCLLGVREFGDRAHHHSHAAQGEQADRFCEFDEEIAAVVDAMNPQLPILDCSPAFSLKIMPVAEGSCFAHVLVHAQSFVAWLQAIARKHGSAGDDSEETPPEFHCAKFRRGRSCVQGLCSAAVVGEAAPRDGAGLPGEIRMRVTFSGLVQMPPQPQGGSGGSSSSSSGSDSSSWNRSMGRGTPIVLPWRFLEDHAPREPQGTLPPDVEAPPAEGRVGPLLSL